MPVQHNRCRTRLALLEEPFSLRRCQNAQHLSILCHRPPCDLNPLFVFQNFDNSLVAERVRLVLLLNDFLDSLLHTLARNVLVSNPADR